MNNPQTQGPSGNGLSGAADNDLRSQVGSVAEQVKAQGQERIESTRQATATTLEKLAEGVRDAASELGRDGTVGDLSTYIVQMSESMTRVASGLRDKSGDDLIHEIGRIARENPTVFVAGAVALGFGLTRFAKASTKHEHGAAKSGADVGSDLASASDTGLALSSAGGRGSQETVFSAGSLGETGSTGAGSLGSRGSSLGTASTGASSTSGTAGTSAGLGASSTASSAGAGSTRNAGSASLAGGSSTDSPASLGYGETPSSSPPTGSTGYGASAADTRTTSDVSAPSGTDLGGPRGLDARGDQGIAGGAADTGLTTGSATTPGLSAGPGASLGVRSGDESDEQGGRSV